MINLSPKPQDPKGLNDAIELIKFINSPDSQKYLKDIQKWVSEANKAIETIGKASDIEKLHAEAKTKTEILNGKIHEIESSREDILKMAEIHAKGIISNAESEAEKLKTSAKKANDKALEREKTSNSKAKELADFEISLKVASQAQQAREKILSQREVEIERKESILAQLKA